MTTATPEAPARTLATIDAELIATAELRERSTGVKKGMLTRKLKGLQAEQAAHPDFQALIAERDARLTDEQEIKIHDSDLIDGVRYSITTDGVVYAPIGDQRLGVAIGRVDRDDKKVWTAQSIYDGAGSPATSRSRRPMLIALINVHRALGPEA